MLDNPNTSNVPHAMTKHEIEASSDKPLIPFPDLHAVPHSLRASPSWVLWRYETTATRNGKWTKVLYREFRGTAQQWLRPASSTNPKTWKDFETVTLTLIDLEELRRVPFQGRWGLGYCLPESATITVIDLDDCRDRNTGAIAEWAGDLVARLDSYTEVSPSGTGLKIYLLGTKPGARCRPSKHHSLYGKIEVYDRARFVAVTGDRLTGLPTDLAGRQVELNQLYADLFPGDTEQHRAPRGNHLCGAGCDHDHVAHSGLAAPTTVAPLDATDAEIVAIASRARNGERFEALWNGDHSAYASRSEADFALASTLAFYVGNDPTRIDSLMRSSGLARDKWTSNVLYLPRTIERALHGRTDFYDPHGTRHVRRPDAIDEEIAGIPDDWMGKNITLTPTTMSAALTMAAVTAGLTELRSAATDGAATPTQRARITAGANDRATTFTAPSSSSLFRDALPPCHTKILVRHKTEVGHAGWIKVRCDRWACPYCLPKLKNTYTCTMLGHIDAEPVEEFHSATVHLPDMQTWKSLYSRIRRAKDSRGRKGRYVCILDFSRVSGEEFLVVATVPFTGSTPLTKRHAIEDVRQTIRSLQTCRKPISKCREWDLPVIEAENKFERIGEIANWATEEHLNDILEKHGLDPARIVASGGNEFARRKIVGMSEFFFPRSWVDSKRLADLFQQLRDGEYSEPDKGEETDSEEDDSLATTTAAASSSYWRPEEED